MADSNSTPPVFGGGDATTSSTPQSTGTTTVAGAGPTGPNSAGLNPDGTISTPTTQAPQITANTDFQKIAGQVVKSGGTAGATPGTPAKPMDEKQLVKSIADAMDIKEKKGEPLEVTVANALAERFGVKIQRSSAGTGQHQGAVGGLRHGIASWFHDASSAVTGAAGKVVAPVGEALIPGSEPAKPSEAQTDEQKYAAALKITSIPLREQAIKAAAKQTPLTQLKAMYAEKNKDQNQTTGGTPEESSKALQDMLVQVAAKLGVQGAGANALQDIAKSSQIQASYEVPGTAASPGSPQTYAQNYVAFTKAYAANAKLSNGQTFQNQWKANLENAGLLNADINTASTSQQQNTVNKTGTLSTTVAQGPTQQQVFNAYQSLLVGAAGAGQSPSEYIQTQSTSPTTSALANGAPSEMYAFVQGVAQEFGVGLTTNQINQIANFYGASASTADDPSSIEDQIKDAVVSLYDPTNPNNPSGVADTMYTDIQQAALEYQIPINSAQLGSMVKQALQGATVESMYVAADAAEASAVKQFQQQAQGLYPSLAPQIAAGNTVQNLVAPYFNVAEAVTGVPASTMQADVASGGVSKWGAFLQGGNNPSGSTQPENSTGKTQAGPQMMTLDQWKQNLMSNPQYGFQNTQGAKDMAEQMSSAILNTFGRVSTISGQPFQAYNGASDLSANES